MALVLTLRSGHDFYIGNHRIVVSWIDSPFRFGLKKDNGTVVGVNDADWTQLYEGVRVQAGIPRNPDAQNLVRLVIDAPEVPIVRGSVYRKKSESICETCSGVGKLRDNVPCSKCGGHGCSSCKDGKVVVEFKCPDCS